MKFFEKILIAIELIVIPFWLVKKQNFETLFSTIKVEIETENLGILRCTYTIVKGKLLIILYIIINFTN